MDKLEMTPEQHPVDMERIKLALQGYNYGIGEKTNCILTRCQNRATIHSDTKSEYKQGRWKGGCYAKGITGTNGCQEGRDHKCL